MEATPAGGRAVVVWGTQLSLAHNSALARAPEAPVVLIESLRVCRRYPYHRQKLRFVLTAMRDFADELRAAGRRVVYRRLDVADPDWFRELGRVCDAHGFRELVAMRAADRAPQRRLEAWCHR
jgi:deoxyribodipyrimidine photolyase-related protein